MNTLPKKKKKSGFFGKNLTVNGTFLNPSPRLRKPGLSFAFKKPGFCRVSTTTRPHNVPMSFSSRQNAKRRFLVGQKMQMAQLFLFLKLHSEKRILGWPMTSYECEYLYKMDGSRADPLPLLMQHSPIHQCIVYSLFYIVVYRKMKCTLY